MRSVRCSSVGCGNRTLDPSGRCYHHQSQSSAAPAAPPAVLSAMKALGDVDLAASILDGNPHAESYTTKDVEVKLTINVTGSRGDIFADGIVPIDVAMVNPDGVEVVVWDYGSSNAMTQTFKDGVEMTSFIHPCDESGNSATSSITSEEFALLVEAYDAAGVMMDHFADTTECDPPEQKAETLLAEVRGVVERLRTRHRLLDEGNPPEWVDAYIDRGD